MNDLFRKHWTTLLGALFILCAMVYTFKYTVDQGLVTDEVKIGIGLLMGAGFSLAGNKLRAKPENKLLSEIIIGLGVGVIYCTFSFAGIYYALWDSMIVFVSMLLVTSGLSYYAYKFDLRVLMNVGIVGALVSPLLLRPENDQVFTLFLYLLVINAGFFVVSIMKKWTELRLVSFVGTWILYLVYYVHFDPATETIWSLPFRYAAAAFVFYVIGFLFTSWKQQMSFDGLNLYLGFANAVIFGLWAVVILDDVAPFAYPLAAMGALYLILAAVVYKMTDGLNMPVMAKAIGGISLLLLAGTQIGKGFESKPIINVFVWLFVAVVLYSVGEMHKKDWFRWVGLAVWFVTTDYWYAVTWYTPRGEWFGTYIPFLNWGALSWELLAAFGFYVALKARFESMGEKDTHIIKNIVAVLSHLIVGGLLTVQVKNIFKIYMVDSSIDVNLTISISWGIYALLLFLWGAYTNQNLFRIFGSVVLGIVAVKTLLLDLSGQESIYRIIVLLILGCISFMITYINSRWRNKVEQ